MGIGLGGNGGELEVAREKNHNRLFGECRCGVPGMLGGRQLWGVGATIKPPAVSLGGLMCKDGGGSFVTGFGRVRVVVGGCGAGALSIERRIYVERHTVPKGELRHRGR